MTSQPATAPAGASEGHLRVAFATGQVIPLSDVDDPAFAQGMLGEGFAIRPATDEVFAPFDGTVTLVAETQHAIGITSDLGEEALLHLGLETVLLAGEGMTCLVKPGELVHAGQMVATADWDAIRDRIDSTDVILAITNSPAFCLDLFGAGAVIGGRTPVFATVRKAP